MLEEQTMEKKNTNRTPSAAKPACLETKAKPELPNKFTRSKKRDNVPGRPEPPRKPFPQRNRAAYDKRPQSRGHFNSDGDRSEVAKTLQDGVVSAFKRGSKKVNLNHLLNFTLAPRESSDFLGPQQQLCAKGRWRQKLPKYNKELFLQANCQFIVREEGDYAIHCVNPDILVDWATVEEIHIPSNEVPSCPICLYPPIAAKITRCGHVYCWACILHYLALTDKSWRRCPICYEAIHKDDLKSVVSVNKPVYKVNDEITMCLMRREKETLFPIPLACWKGKYEKPFHLSDDQRVTCFQKLLTATVDQVNEIIHREEAELKHQLLEESETPEACFVETALQLLEQREKVLKGIIDSVQKVSADPTDDTIPQVDTLHLDSDLLTNNNNVDNGNIMSPETCIETVSPDHLDPNAASVVVAEDLELTESPEKQATKDSYYFFQAADGQQIYLHSLNVKMLMKEYGSLEQCPSIFSARILEIEGISINENLRKRLRYLRHLPLTCEIQVVELKLEPPLVSQSTVELFRGDIEKRRRNRNRRARDERKRDRHIESEELKKWGKYPGARFSLNSMKHFPACANANDIQQPQSPSPAPSEDSFSTSPMNTPGGIPIPVSLEDAASHSCNSVDSTEEFSSTPQRMSFAQMLRNGAVKPPSMLQPSMIQKAASRESADCGPADSDCDDCAPVPEYHQSFSSALQAAFDNLAKADAAGDISQGKKKKKGKKMVLFATSMNRSK